MYLPEAHLVTRVSGHQPCEGFIDLEKDVHAHAEIAGVEQAASLLMAVRCNFLVTLQPTCRSTDHGEAERQAFHYIVVCAVRAGELDGGVCGGGKVGVQFGCVVQIDATKDLVSPAKGRLFDDASHLPISYQYDLHGLVLCSDCSG